MDFEHRKRRAAAIWTVGVNAVIISLLFIVIAWKEPNPPLPEYGVIIEFGLDDQGSGDISNQQQPEQETAEQTPTEETTREMVEEVPVEDTPTEEISNDATQEEGLVEAEETPAQNQQQQEEEEKQEETPVVNKDALYPGGGKGDDTEAGDKGSETGSVDDRALYGQEGGGGGASLNLTGWKWSQIPRPNDTTKETGEIVFEVTIDANGYVVSVVTVRKTVSPVVEKLYRDEVQKTEFIRTAETAPPSRSKGTITFKITGN